MRSDRNLGADFPRTLLSYFVSNYQSVVRALAELELVMQDCLIDAAELTLARWSPIHDVRSLDVFMSINLILFHY